MIAAIKNNFLIIIGTFLFLYFFFNLLDGERGLISLIKKENLLKQLKLKENNLEKNISDLEFKNFLLSDNFDTDYIEILLRENFVYTKKNETIYILKKNEKSN
tara:strand:+ start:2678 stop:2986 length:309 start_codon:yes stop_codon:yes gene_type:complete